MSAPPDKAEQFCAMFDSSYKTAIRNACKNLKSTYNQTIQRYIGLRYRRQQLIRKRRMSHERIDFITYQWYKICIPTKWSRGRFHLEMTFP